MQTVNQDEAVRAPRAQRFAVQMPLRCRVAGQTEWLSGRTENISRTGVLFRSEQWMGVNTKVEMILDMGHLTATPCAEVACTGHIVRVIAGDTQPSPAIAATIEEFRFLRETDLPMP